ncbi:MAG: ABC transporter permease [Defluviitaleaceae bacterium]|nr:ABC transporter permease [Defluviitaleaceae bacterium]
MKGDFMDKFLKGSGLSIVSSVAVVIAGMLLGFIVLFISNASQAPAAIVTILTFGFSSLRNFGDVLYFATPIIMTGLSVGFAYKTGLFNIGASGQFTFGAFVAVYIALNFEFLAPPLRIIAALAAAMLAGALWAAIPGLLKAYRNVHEVISCIMTNYIGMFLVNYLILTTIFDPMRASSQRVPPSTHIPIWGLDSIFTDAVRASPLNASIFVAIFSALLMYIILDRTTFGYELKACGLNKDAAKYAGINENRSIIFSMMISGALAGLGGGMHFLSGAGRTMSVADVLANEGFMGISVSLLGLNHPIGIIFSGVLIAYLQRGGFNIQPLGFAQEIIEIAIAVIIYFCAFVLLVRTQLGNVIAKTAAIFGNFIKFGADKSSKSAKSTKGKAV